LGKYAVHIVAIVTLSVTWIIFSENFSLVTAIIGVIFSVACIHISFRLLPLPAIGSINVFRLVLYPFYLIGQIYLTGFSAMKLILMGASTNVVVTKTSITNNFLRMLLANAITLTPGTATLNMEEDELTVLYLKLKNTEDEQDPGEAAKGGLERFLIKIQK